MGFTISRAGRDPADHRTRRAFWSVATLWQRPSGVVPFPRPEAPGGPAARLPTRAVRMTGPANPMSTLAIYNTLTRSKETFVPLVAGPRRPLRVRAHRLRLHPHRQCAHLLGVRPRRALAARERPRRPLRAQHHRRRRQDHGARPRAAASPSRRSPSARWRAFAEDCARLNLLAPDSEPRATRYIGPMLELIETLEKKGLAYRGANGDVYYSVRDFPGYGKLSRRNLDDLRAGERVAVEAAKRDPLDFVLWKAAKPGEPSWPSAFGAGRPGLAHRVLGHVVPRAGRDLRHPRRRLGPAVPAPRERDRAERGREREAVRELLDALGVPQHGRREDVEVARQRVHGARGAREARSRAGRRAAALLPAARPLPQRARATRWDLLEDAGNTLRGFYTTLREVPPDAGGARLVASRLRSASATR